MVTFIVWPSTDIGVARVSAAMTVSSCDVGQIVLSVGVVTALALVPKRVSFARVLHATVRITQQNDR